MADLITYTAVKDYTAAMAYGEARQAEYLDHVSQAYADALRNAVRKQKKFFRKYQAVMNGEIEPPLFYVNQGEEAVNKWRQGFILQLIRQGDIVENIANDMIETMKLTPDALDDMLADIYMANRNATVSTIMSQVGQYGMSIRFNTYSKSWARNILDQSKGAMTKIAYRRFSDTKDLQDRLQRQMFAAVTSGESQRQFDRRIRNTIAGRYDPEVLKNSRDPLLKACRNIAQYEARCAKRIGRTEMTRIQSQARYEAAQEAVQLGIRQFQIWRCKMMPTSRDTHRNANGQAQMVGDFFTLSDGDQLLYPGDPNGAARNVINCYCVAEPHVLLPGEYLVDGKVAGSASDARRSYTNSLKDYNDSIDIQDNLLYNSIGNIEQQSNSRQMANGLRRSPHDILTDDEIENLKQDIRAIQAEESVFSFNHGARTGYVDDIDTIYVKGDVMPSRDGSVYARDLMSSRAVLAHEYYGHRANRNTPLPIGDWRDEFRASYSAAMKAPGLSDVDKQMLVRDAMDRAKEAGVPIRINTAMRRILYGF